MSSSEQSIAFDDSLVAYVDGELPESEIALLEAELRKNKALRGQLSRLCRQRFMLADILCAQKMQREEPDKSQVDTPTKKIVRHDFSHKTTQKAAAINGPRKNKTVGQKRTRRHQRRLSKQRLSFAAGIAAALLLGFLAYITFAPAAIVEPADTGIVQQVDDLPVIGHKKGHIDWARDYQVGDQVHAQDEIALSDAASLTLNYKDGSILVLDQAARFTVLKAKRIFMHTGQVKATVRKQASGESLGIETDAGQITVLGTQFTVALSDEAVLTTVREGIVQLTSALNQQRYLVHAQEACSLHKTDAQQIHQYITGTIVEIGDGDAHTLRLQTSLGEKVYAVPWRGGFPKDGGGPDEQVIKQLRRMRVGNTVRVRWLDDAERLRVLHVERIDD